MTTYASADGFPPTRAAALERLAAFVPDAGRVYTSGRNFDRGGVERNHVSALSPYIGRRMITETEVVRAVLAEHDLSSAEKFVQEVCWRTYWKGWMERRPEVWAAYRDGVHSWRGRLKEDPGLCARYTAAVEGRTSITSFNHWAGELRENGYLHNHARMWFAGIWIYSLGLPWMLGADFFARHLLDGDAASNTLSWRWVAGLHTKGKRYKPRASNIETYTGGRFAPGEIPWPHEGPAFTEHPDLRPSPEPEDAAHGFQTVVLCADDLAMDLPSGLTRDVRRVVIVRPENRLGYWERTDAARAFDAACIEDAARRWREVAEVEALPQEEFASRWRGRGAERTGMPYVPRGAMRDFLDRIWREGGQKPTTWIRRWDVTLWPHARTGFFGFWKKVRPRLAELVSE